MSIVTIRLPEVKRKTSKRPRKCSHCEGETFQGWGKVRKPVRDQRMRNVEVSRYRCCRCGRVFRYYPEGIDRADQTQRMRKLVVILWVLGLSLRGVKLALAVWGIKLSHTTVWRDIAEAGKQVKQQRQWGRVRVLGVDGAFVLVKGKKRPVLIAVDVGTGKPVAIASIDESNPQAVRRFLEPLVQRLGVSVIVTDDLASYRTVSEKLGVEHQVCQFHVRRWVGKALRELRETVPKEWVWVLEEIKRLIAELPPEGSRRLFDIWKTLPERNKVCAGSLTPLSQLSNLLIRLSEHWPSYRVFTWSEDVPWTNNGTEQAIGKMKMRSRTVRGYKSDQGMHHALILAGCGVDF